MGGKRRSVFRTTQHNLPRYVWVSVLGELEKSSFPCPGTRESRFFHSVPVSRLQQWGRAEESTHTTIFFACRLPFPHHSSREVFFSFLVAL